MVEKIQTILICKLKFYGDMLLMTPVIASLQQRYPQAKIDILLYKDTKAILAADPRINKFYLIEKKVNTFKKIRNFLSVRSALKKNKYDLIINLTEQWPIGFLIFSLGRPSIAFKREKSVWNRLFSVVTPLEGTHIVEQNLSILQGVGISGNGMLKKISLFYRETDYQSLFVIDPNFNNGNYIVIQPTARQPFKCWDDDKFSQVIDYLMQRGLQVILTCGPAESELQKINNIARLCQENPNVLFAGKTSFLQLAALIDHAILYIGVDSAPMHMAAALDTPQVCLFGATSYRQWRPWSDKASLIWAGDYHTMPERQDLDRTKKYLSWIPVQAVIEAAESLINQECMHNNDGKEIDGE
ncbi:lipopolysaccharide core heptosyltransferase RfaQ [Cedecea colo]|uniref:Lipopolysaccharide core heptosyltransferase RfaQ n=1 Tax=Cedecea colo TaxID=2552946 RepID=A0ABX0VSK0_9ENTR|nr:lipopolysaccharide core heptosyltransferase RfaQ [Cedecea colo]NIY49741.1 lipopolysaccharide core heptosyltransferase RfaQ [Cedecea colo]